MDVGPFAPGRKGYQRLPAVTEATAVGKQLANYIDRKKKTVSQSRLRRFSQTLQLKRSISHFRFCLGCCCCRAVNSGGARRQGQVQVQVLPLSRKLAAKVSLTVCLSVCLSGTFSRVMVCLYLAVVQEKERKGREVFKIRRVRVELDPGDGGRGRCRWLLQLA